MGEKVSKTGVEKKKGYLYYVDKQGDVAQVKAARGGKKKGSPKKIATPQVKKDSGYLYYVDKDGDVARSKMVRGHAKGKVKPPKGKTKPPEIFEEDDE